MSFDDWKCTPPEGIEEEPDEGDLETEPEFTCDCGQPLDEGSDVSLCAECLVTCETWPAPANPE